MPVPKAPVTRQVVEHRFLDRTNKIEFAASASLATLDTIATCHNLNNGGKEFWVPVHSCGQMAAFSAGEQAAAWGVSWVLYKMHHHKLENIPALVFAQGNLRGYIYSKEHEVK